MKKLLIFLVLVVASGLMGCSKPEAPPAPEASASPAPTGTVTTPNGVQLPANSIAAQDFRDGKK